jgi:uncharacterized DUF497 family protein
VSVFDWDDANRSHIARHGVSVDEAEQACTGNTLDLDSYTVGGELRYEDLGSTDAGRILKLVTTDRAGRIRIVTAFDAPQVLKQLYLGVMVRRHE